MNIPKEYAPVTSTEVKKKRIWPISEKTSLHVPLQSLISMPFLVLPVLIFYLKWIKLPLLINIAHWIYPYYFKWMEIVHSWCCVVFHRMKAPVCICFPGSSASKESTCPCRRHKRHEFKPWVRKISWRRKWQPTPVFSTGKFHEQRCLVGHTVHAVAESDMTEREHKCACVRTPTHIHSHTHNVLTHSTVGE